MSVILLSYRGSVAHNLYIDKGKFATDDIDLMGVCIYPEDYYLGLRLLKETVEEGKNTSLDVVYYELKHFVRLLLKCNPNVLSLLWNNPKMCLDVTKDGEELIENREIFSSKYAYNAFVGYANSQLAKMEKQKYKGYMGDKRKALVEKFGYDTKNASHLIRLLKMGIEFLETGKLRVFRDYDRDYLLDIKTGKFSLSEIKKKATELFSQAKDAYEKSPLPEEPDYEKANELVLEILRGYYE